MQALHCRGIIENPLPLTSGHILPECVAVKGTCIEFSDPLAPFFFLDCTQVHKCVKASDPSLTSLHLQEGVKELLNLSLSMGSPTSQRSPLKNTSRGAILSRLMDGGEDSEAEI